MVNPIELLYEEDLTPTNDLFDNEELNMSSVVVHKNDSFYYIQGEVTNKSNATLKDVTVIWNIYYKSRGKTLLAENLKSIIEYMLPGDTWKFRTADFKSALGANPIAIRLVDIIKS